MDEAEVVRSRRSVTDVSISNGVTVVTASDRVVLRFSLGAPITDVPGSPVKVELGGDWYDGELMSVAGDICTLALPREVNRATEGRLRLDAAHLLGLQEKQLRTLSRPRDRSTSMQRWPLCLPLG